MSTADGKIRFSTEIDNSKMEKALSSILKTIQAFSGDSSKAVSYTHLDVYKRQG